LRGCLGGDGSADNCAYREPSDARSDGRAPAAIAVATILNVRHRVVADAETRVEPCDLSRSGRGRKGSEKHSCGRDGEKASLRNCHVKFSDGVVLRPWQLAIF
jgi:hypothetical protein